MSKKNQTVKSAIVKSAIVNPIIRKSSIFTDYPSLSVEFEALTKICINIGKRIEQVHYELRAQEHEQAKRNELESIAVKAWNVWNESGMNGISYLDITKRQIQTMNELTESIPDRTKITVQSRTKRISVNNTGSINNAGTDNDLINRIAVQFNGSPIGSLPVDIQALFNRTTARKYSSVSCYLQQLINRTGNGIIADAIKTSPDEQSLFQTINESGIHETTISRFKHAYRIYQSMK